jgi:hypothetical protein
MYAPSILDSWILWLILLNVDHPGANASGSKHVEHRRCGEDDGQAPIQRGYLPTQKAERGARDSMHWEARWGVRNACDLAYALHPLPRQTGVQVLASPWQTYLSPQGPV